MEGIELKARREALGLSQKELAKYLDITQTTLSRWEGNVSAPKDPVSVSMIISDLEEELDDMIDEAIDFIVGRSAKLNTPFLPVQIFEHTQTLDDSDNRFKGVAASMHRVAMARAASAVREEYSIEVSLIPGGVE